MGARNMGRRVLSSLFVISQVLEHSIDLRSLNEPDPARIGYRHRMVDTPPVRGLAYEPAKCKDKSSRLDHARFQGRPELSPLWSGLNNALQPDLQLIAVRVLWLQRDDVAGGTLKNARYNRQIDARWCLRCRGDALVCWLVERGGVRAA